MKKINNLELIVISVGIIAGCFSISKFVYCKFGMASDFLTASATFIAAVVAISLFNDWRLQYRTELFERLKDRIHNVFLELERQYEILYGATVLDKQDINIIGKECLTIIGIIQNLEIEFDFYEKLIKKYNLDINLISKKPSDLKVEFKDFKNAFTGEIIVEDGADIHLLKHISDYLESSRAYEILIPNKSIVNSDLQTIILNLIDEQKGH